MEESLQKLLKNSRKELHRVFLDKFAERLPGTIPRDIPAEIRGEILNEILECIPEEFFFKYFDFLGECLKKFLNEF